MYTPTVLNFSPEKLFLVGVIALFVLGPNRLPQAARTLGRFAATVRRMSSGFHDEVRSALAEPTEVVSSAVSEFRVPDVRRSVREAVSSTFAPPEPSSASGPPSANPQRSPALQPAPSVQPAPAPAQLPPGNPDDPSLN
jgi:sec-independent protein translocase protein TatB